MWKEQEVVKDSPFFSLRLKKVAKKKRQGIIQFIIIMKNDGLVEGNSNCIKNQHHRSFKDLKSFVFFGLVSKIYLIKDNIKRERRERERIGILPKIEIKSQVKQKKKKKSLHFGKI